MNVGIFGGGQLALMLATAAKELGLRPWALVGASGEPVEKVVDEVRRWDPRDPTPVRDFLNHVECVAFENEFFPSFVVEQARDLRNKFCPALSVMETVRNKLSQKQALARWGLPTAPFVPWVAGSSVSSWIHEALERFTQGAVFKWALGGYDGKGVCIVKPGDPQGYEKAFLFCTEAERRGIPLFVEECVSFVRELAIIGVRGSLGPDDFAAYPLVVSEQERGICKWVTGPATSLGVSAALEDEARRCAEKFSLEMDLRGAFGMEFFETSEGAILVNEMAPRVHNSGHYTQNACEVSQFVNHWKALLGEALGSTRSRWPAFAMLNLLGPEDGLRPRSPSKINNIYFHDYFKSECRVGRKMAHLNGVASSIEELPSLVKTLDQQARDWAGLKI